MYTDKEVEVTKWKTPGDDTIFSIQEVAKAVRAYMRDPEHNGSEYDFVVGTDSQMIGHAFQFISVISCHRIGKGGIYWTHKEYVPRVKFPVENQKMRMFDEVTRSITLALYVQEHESLLPVVHIDASPAHKPEFTAKFSDQLKGYVQGSGFDCRLKPESYVAHAIADKHTKKKSRKRQRKMRQAERLRRLKAQS